MARAGVAGTTVSSVDSCTISMHHRRELTRRADLNEANRAFFRVCEAVRHECIEAFPTRVFRESCFEHGATAGGDECCLNSGQSMLWISVHIHAVEDRPNDVEVA